MPVKPRLLVIGSCIFIVLALLAIYYLTPTYEGFLYTRFECPTRNMSYDLRGEAYFPPRDLSAPWGLPTIGPLDPSACSPRPTLP